MKYEKIGDGEPCFIIAEAGVNHNGDIKTAKKLVDAAKYAKVNAVKFQTFNTEKIVISKTKKANYQKRAYEKTQYEMLKNLELTFEEFKELKQYCDEKKIEFMSTPYDIQSVNFLNDINVKRFKIASADIINRELIEAVAKTKKQIILSTGMATIKEIKRTKSLINKLDNKDVVILHCTTMYPTPYNQVNMNFLKTLKKLFDVPIGYSDHTQGIEIPIMAVSFGADVIEKHITLDKNMTGPDHFASLNPDEMKKMVESIRNIEKSFGGNDKHITGEEEKNIFFMRRSIHASKDIEKGEKITRHSLKITRPNDGMKPWYIDRIINKKSKRYIRKDCAINQEDVL